MQPFERKALEDGEAIPTPADSAKYYIQAVPLKYDNPMHFGSFISSEGLVPVMVGNVVFRQVDKRVLFVYLCREVIDLNENIKSTQMHIRVNPDVRERAMEVLNEIGISASDLFNMLLSQVAIQHRIPFDLVDSKYICSNGCLHDYSKISPRADDEYIPFDNWREKSEN